MSEFHVIEVEIYDKDCLIDALKEMGYNPELYDNPVHLYGYEGDKRIQKAHIRIPRSQIGSASNDVGFEKIGNKYILHLSAYDIHVKKFDKQKLMQLYGKHKVEKIVKKQSRKFKKKSQYVDEKGNIKIRLTRR